MENFEQKVIDITVKNTKQFLFDSLDKYNSDKSNVIEYTFDYEIVGDFIFSIAYLITSSEYFNHIYRMDVRNIYGVDKLYFSGNVTGGKTYTIEDVKKQCKAYFNSYAKDFNKIID